MTFATGLLVAKALALSVMGLKPWGGGGDSEGWPDMLDSSIETIKNLTSMGQAGAEVAYSVTFPGTKWCGIGNTSKSYDDLGWFSSVDQCCREHDFCPDFIPPGEEKHGLINPRDFTISLCACDHFFLHCLRENKNMAAREIGRLYFDFVGPTCFAYDYPITGCRRKDKSKRCVRYSRDRRRPMKWQLQDFPYYFDKHRLSDFEEIQQQAGNALLGQEIHPALIGLSMSHWDALLEASGDEEENAGRFTWFRKKLGFK